jgi:hypothetical protein
MADRHKSFFGPVLPQAADAPPAITWGELQKIRARRLEADLVRAAGPAWPEQRRFETEYGVRASEPDEPHGHATTIVSGAVRIVVRGTS